MDGPSVRPTPEQLERLDRFERFAFELVDFVNTNPLTKATASAFLRSVGMTWVHLFTRRLIHLVGFEKLRHFRPSRGVLLACNHRSFFDLYVVNCWLYRTSQLLRRTYFPVRAEFFYDRAPGVLVNLLMSAMTMYPPVFREPSKRDFNRYGLRRLSQLLQSPGTVVGVHPEGQRSLGADPYDLQRAQPGVGKLIMEAQPVVLPVFINGLGNEVFQQIGGNFDGTGKPIIIVAGAPLDLSEFLSRRNTLRVQKQLSDHVLEEIRLLGEQEREVRASLGPSVRGPIVHS